MPLSDALADPALRTRLLDACVRALEEEVEGKRGISGMAIRSGYAAFQKVQPGIARSAFERLLPLFAPAIEPCWCEAQASGSPNAWFEQHAGEVADALLGVTDAQAARAKNQALATLYRSLRGMARPHVIAAVPRLPGVLAVVSPDQPVV